MATLETAQRCEDTMGANLDESSDGDTAWRGVAEGVGSCGVQETWGGSRDCVRRRRGIGSRRGTTRWGGIMG
jgi:hypothetical protein